MIDGYEIKDNIKKYYSFVYLVYLNMTDLLVNNKNKNINLLIILFIY